MKGFEGEPQRDEASRFLEGVWHYLGLTHASAGRLNDIFRHACIMQEQGAMREAQHALEERIRYSPEIGEQAWALDSEQRMRVMAERHAAGFNASAVQVQLGYAAWMLSAAPTESRRSI
jgi:hypothetical protein